MTAQIVKLNLPVRHAVPPADTTSPTEVPTVSGKRLDLLAPSADSISIEDIAHGLAAIQYHGPQSPSPYTVAEHAIYASFIAPQRAALATLLWHAPRAYLGLVTTAYFNMIETADVLGTMLGLERVLRDVIYRHFGLDPSGVAKHIEHATATAHHLSYRYLFHREPVAGRPFPLFPADAIAPAYLTRFTDLITAQSDLSG